MMTSKQFDELNCLLEEKRMAMIDEEDAVEKYNVANDRYKETRQAVEDLGQKLQRLIDQVMRQSE